MRKSIVVVYDPVLEWCLGKDCQIIDYLEHMTQPGLLAPVSKSRYLTLSEQLIMFRRPVLEIYSQGKSLNLLKGINIPSEIWVPHDGAVLEVGANE